MIGYSIHPIPTLPTREIHFNGRCVGFLRQPRLPDEAWDIVPDAKDTSGLPDGDQGYRHRAFATEAEALIFLGISEERVAA